MENETFFFSFLITYTYRFSHLLAKLCREHFKDELDLPEVPASMGLFYHWKHLLCQPPSHLRMASPGYRAHVPTTAKNCIFPRALYATLTQMDFTDIYGISPFYFVKLGRT